MCIRDSDDTDRLEMEPPKSYPGKLTKFLYERYKHFNGAMDKGLVMLPVEPVSYTHLPNEKQMLERAYEEYQELKKNNLWGSHRYE